MIGWLLGVFISGGKVDDDELDLGASPWPVRRGRCDVGEGCGEGGGEIYLGVEGRKGVERWYVRVVVVVVAVVVV